MCKKKPTNPAAFSTKGLEPRAAQWPPPLLPGTKNGLEHQVGPFPLFFWGWKERYLLETIIWGMKLPETNSLHLKDTPLEKFGSSYWKPSFLGPYVGFREGIHVIQVFWKKVQIWWPPQKLSQMTHNSRAMGGLRLLNNFQVFLCECPFRGGLN